MYVFSMRERMFNFLIISFLITMTVTCKLIFYLPFLFVSFPSIHPSGDELERNDGSPEKPFVMSPELHRILGKSSRVHQYSVLFHPSISVRESPQELFCWTEQYRCPLKFLSDFFFCIKTQGFPRLCECMFAHCCLYL